ncbi:MAG: redoxin domain-containing protein [Bacteroidota bacterium]
MKQLLTAIIILITLGCQEDQKGYSLSGELENVEDGTMIYVSELDQNMQPSKTDSVQIQKGEFKLDMAEVEHPNLSFLSVEGYNGNVIFISENEPINFEIYKDSLPTSKVTGGEENEVFYTYLDHLKGLNNRVMQIRTEMREVMTTTRDSAAMVELQKQEEELRTTDMTFKKNLVEEHPDRFVSVLVLTDMMNMGASANEVKELFETLSENATKSSLAKSLEESLNKRSAVDIGSKAPEFSAPNPEGEQVSLKDSMGKVTLIDFWAAWCKPCRVENPNIVKTYNKYHDKGFNIIGVSLDREGQKDKWIQAIEDDNLTWPQVSNLKFWQEPVAQLYGVQAIPAQFILDENGVIVAKNLRGDALDAKVKELLEK